MPSFPMLFRVCKEENQPPISYVCSFLHTLGLSSWSEPISTPNSVQTKAQMHTKKNTQFWVEERWFRKQNELSIWVKQPLIRNFFSRFIYGPNVAKTSSTTELWTLAPYLAWLLKHLHTQHKEHPLLCYTVPQAMPSLLVLFRVCKEENHPRRSVC